MNKTCLSSDLSCKELEAGNFYCTQSIIFNAIFQGWNELVGEHSTYSKEIFKIKGYRDALDSAIKKSSLVENLELWSGHGIGSGVRGAISGKAECFIGNEYNYSGFISTSCSKDISINNFIKKTADTNSRPTLLKFCLPKGFNVIDVASFGHYGESEYIIGRCRKFIIKNAYYKKFDNITDEVLVLELKPDDTETQ